ncbi:MAG: hypothetical protein EOM21_19140 [Gammaproteobacteria bacterium]|nr:hypothetical protein [Gammaproteobacteria bacterium]
MPEPTAQQTQTEPQQTQTEPQKTETAEQKFSQAEVDRIVQERLNRDRAKFADYEDLRRKASDYEKQQEQLKQMDLEKKQEYDKLKSSWEQKENEYKSMLDKTRSEVQTERVNNALNQAILKSNAYPEAAQLLRAQSKYNEDGTITISGKDANGMDTDLPIEKGVEQFLRDRPYLVKGGQTTGAGTASGGGTAQTTQENLGQLLQNAMAVGDRKLVQEIKQKIKLKHAGAGLL